MGQNVRNSKMRGENTSVLQFNINGLEKQKLFKIGYNKT